MEVRNFSVEIVKNSMELPLSVWTVLESQRLRFMEEASTGASLTQAEQRKRNDVQENLPEMQNPI